jgi:hypothetical protein
MPRDLHYKRKHSHLFADARAALHDRPAKKRTAGRSYYRCPNPGGGPGIQVLPHRRVVADDGGLTAEPDAIAEVSLLCEGCLGSTGSLVGPKIQSEMTLSF